MLPFRISLGWTVLGPMEIGALVGVLMAALLARRRMASRRIAASSWLDLALGALLGGAAGARLFCAVPAWIRGTEVPGSGIYGGLAGGTLALVWVARIKGIPLLETMDAAAAVLPAGFAVGKLGCFLAGCCYGIPCGEPPGVRFPPGSLAFETHRAAGLLPPGSSTSLPVHPTQIYEMAFGVALFAGLSLLSRRSYRPGTIVLTFALLYSFWRFGIEFLRDDPDRHGFGCTTLTDAQITALIVGSAAGGVLGIRRWKSPAPTPPPPPISPPPPRPAR